jgi:predicted nucleic acid-binding protein
VNLLDSSGWLEFFGNGPHAGEFLPALADLEQLLVPTIVLYEVSKRVTLLRGEGQVAEVVATMRRGRVVDLDTPLALSAAAASVAERLPMADAIILATARRHSATVWTMDSDFEGKAGVRYYPR